MTIYVTARKPDDALSIDSGFESIQQVVDVLGVPESLPTPRMVFYPDAVFSDFAFRIDAPDFNA